MVRGRARWLRDDDEGRVGEEGSKDVHGTLGVDGGEGARVNFPVDSDRFQVACG